MAAITVADVRITLLPTANPAGSTPQQVEIVGRQKRARVRISISATSSLSYPSSGGIPLPTFNATAGLGDLSYGMVRNISHVIFYGNAIESHPSQAANRRGVVWKYDAPNHLIRGFQYGGFASAIGPSEGHNATGLTELPTTFFASFAAPSGANQMLSWEAEVVGW